jgi:hypothetical protein
MESGGSRAAQPDVPSSLMGMGAPSTWAMPSARTRAACVGATASTKQRDDLNGPARWELMRLSPPLLVLLPKRGEPLALRLRLRVSLVLGFPSGRLSIRLRASLFLDLFSSRLGLRSLLFFLLLARRRGRHARSSCSRRAADQSGRWWKWSSISTRSNSHRASAGTDTCSRRHRRHPVYRWWPPL